MLQRVAKFRQAIGELFAGFAPSKRDEKPYKHALIAIGHAIVGACIVSLFGFIAWPIRIGIAAGLYWRAKEKGDLERGGHVRDGLIDSGFVAYGALYSGPFLWPFALLLLAGISGVLNRVFPARNP